MIDIVDRLRAPSGGVVADTQILNAAIEAADEIERLLAALKDIAETIPHNKWEDQECQAMAKEALAPNPTEKD